MYWLLNDGSAILSSYATHRLVSIAFWWVLCTHNQYNVSISVRHLICMLTWAVFWMTRIVPFLFFLNSERVLHFIFVYYNPNTVWYGVFCVCVCDLEIMNTRAPHSSVYLVSYPRRRTSAPKNKNANTNKCRGLSVYHSQPLKSIENKIWNDIVHTILWCTVHTTTARIYNKYMCNAEMELGYILKS